MFKYAGHWTWDLGPWINNDFIIFTFTCKQTWTFGWRSFDSMRCTKWKASSHLHSLIGGYTQRVIFSHWDYCFMWLFVSSYHKGVCSLEKDIVWFSGGFRGCKTLTILLLPPEGALSQRDHINGGDMLSMVASSNV